MNAGDNLEIRGIDDREWFGKVARNVIEGNRVLVWWYMEPGIDVPKRQAGDDEIFLSNQQVEISIDSVNRRIEITEGCKGEGLFRTSLWLNNGLVKVQR